MDDFIDEGSLRKLDQLALLAKQMRAGYLQGDRRSKQRGTSIEFADYRDYVRGDDLRRLDWNVYARLDKLFVKLLEAEEELTVHLVVDRSKSMAWPLHSADTKFRYASRLAAGLAYIALAEGDAVTLSWLGDERRWGPYRGKQNALRAIQFFAQGTVDDSADFNTALQQYAQRAGRPGLLILLTDLLNPIGYEEGLKAVQGRGYEVVLLQLLSADEWEPDFRGDFRLLDVETGEEAEITLDEETLEQYRQQLGAWVEQIGRFCQQRHIRYTPLSTAISWDTVLLHSLRQRVIR